MKEPSASTQSTVEESFRAIMEEVHTYMCVCNVCTLHGVVSMCTLYIHTCTVHVRMYVHVCVCLLCYVLLLLYVHTYVE